MNKTTKGSGFIRRFGEGNLVFIAKMILFAIWLLISSTIALIVTPFWWLGSGIYDLFNLAKINIGAQN